MKGFKPFPLAGLGLIFCTMLMSGCGGKTPQNGPSALNITNLSNFPPGAVGDFYMEGLVATGGLQPYTWTIDSGALPAGLTLSSSGVISGTPTTIGMSSFTVRVTDSQSPVKAYQTGSATLTINPPLSFSTTTLANAVIAAAYSSTVVQSSPSTPSPAGGVPPYKYSVISDSGCLFTNTKTCSSNGGLTLNADGSITGTPTGPAGTFPFTVQVTDSYPTTATANFSITVTGKVQGNYAFSFNGYNQQGRAFYMVGSFVADGAGNITSGVFDRNGNDSIGPMTNVTITPGSGAAAQCPASGPPSGTGSVYCVGRPGVTNGSNLGTIVIASALGTYSFSVSVSLTTDSALILADPNNPNAWGSGVLKSQGQSLSGISLNSGNFAFGLFGVDPSGKRYGGAGYFATDASGNITAGNGLADLNDNGAVQSQVPLTGSVLPFSNSTGRGTATFTIGSNTLNYAFYVVGPPAGKLFPTLLAVQTDAVSTGAAVTLASISERSPTAGGGFTVKSLNATRGGNPNGAVFELNAVSAANGAPDISLGLGNFDGNGNITSYTFDENNGGTLTPPASNNCSGTYTVGILSGRVAVNLSGPGCTSNPVWYLVTFNTGFVVGTDPSVTVGAFEPQAVSQPIFIVSLFGNFYGATSNPVLPSVINEVEAAVATPPPPPGAGNGTFVTTYDTSGTTGVMMNLMFNGAFCIADGNSCPNPQQGQTAIGRFLILDSNGNPADILYVVSGGSVGTTGSVTRDVILNAGANPSLTAIVH